MKHKKIIFGIIGFVVGICVSYWLFYPYNFLSDSHNAGMIRSIILIICTFTVGFGIAIAGWEKE